MGNCHFFLDQQKRGGVGLRARRSNWRSVRPRQDKANFPASSGLRHPSVAEALDVHFWRDVHCDWLHAATAANRRKYVRLVGHCVRPADRPHPARIDSFVVPGCDGEGMGLMGGNRRWERDFSAPTVRKPFGARGPHRIGASETLQFHPCLPKLRHCC